MVPWKKTLTIPSLRKNDHRTGLGANNDFNENKTIKDGDIAPWKDLQKN